MFKTSPTALSFTVAKLVALCAATGHALAQDRPLDGDFPEVYRVGGLTAPPWAQFDNPSRMGFDAVGNLYLRGLRATWEGSFWVRRRGEEPWDDLGPIDVVGPDRQYRGTLAAGDPMPMAFGPEGLVAYLERNELDVPIIVVKRLSVEVR